MSKKKNSYEEYPFEPEDHPTMIRPHVFGRGNKFGGLDDNGRHMKVNGKHRHVVGEAATLRATGYWHLIHAMLRELNMSYRDRVILDAHVNGKTAKQINRALAEHDYLKPYKKSQYINDRIQQLVRKYFLTPKSQLNRI